MTAKEWIEAYVTDVAVRLPRRQRNDVACELNALLEEELRARAEDAGREADDAMASQMLRDFGRPAEVAARYRAPLTIVDPADGRRFLRATVWGLAAIWSLGLLAQLQPPIGSGSDLLLALGRWWVGTVIPSLWWPGVLVVGFGLASWSRRRWPQTSEWKPRATDRLVGGRAALATGLLGVLCGLFVLIDPAQLLDFLFGGRAAPAAYEALTYTEAFRHRQGPLLLGLLLLQVPLWLAVLVQGRWSASLRRLRAGLTIALCAVMAWTALDGPVFAAPASDRTVKFFLVLIVAYVGIEALIQFYRRVAPAPNPELPARR